jgi:outer membrane scaffolding protein for murein synthesis (MipA/OmpV family)
MDIDGSERACTKGQWSLVLRIADVGLGAASKATYEGGAQRRTIGGPDLSFSYRSRDGGSVTVDRQGLVCQALKQGEFKLGLAAAADPGRKDRKPSAGDPTPGDRGRPTLHAGLFRRDRGPGLGLGLPPLHAQGGLVLSQLAGDAKDNPLVARKSSTSVAVGLACAF